MRIAQVVIDAKIYHHQCVVAKKKQTIAHYSLLFLKSDALRYLISH